VLLASVFEIGRGAHELERLVLVALRLLDQRCAPRICTSICSAQYDWLAFCIPSRSSASFSIPPVQQAGSPLLAAPIARAKYVIASAGGNGRSIGLQLRGALPVLAFEHVPRRNCGARGVSGRDWTDHLLDYGVLVDQRLRLGVLAELQVGVLHEVIRVRHAGKHAIELRLCAVLVRDLDRLQVRLDRLVPHADHRVDMRGHVLRMRRCGRIFAYLLAAGTPFFAIGAKS
jgi:hypothetical protein